MKKLKLAIPCILIFMTTSCSRGYEPIEYGSDACADCKMTIMDDRFASELIDKKGKVAKFDDLICMKNYLSDHPEIELGQLFIEEYYKNADKPLDASSAVYLQHEFFKSPMNGNYAAFRDQQEAMSLKDSLGIEILTWDNLK